MLNILFRDSRAIALPIWFPCKLMKPGVFNRLRIRLESGIMVIKKKIVATLIIRVSPDPLSDCLQRSRDSKSNSEKVRIIESYITQKATPDKIPKYAQEAPLSVLSAW
ncbi:MAG: hypothetical protein QG646_3826, partial [Euryarchaeota archaeon]|nr:hypothetical protein [Euryarchaeota archaeon]